jgi:hypothetical protein
MQFSPIPEVRDRAQTHLKWLLSQEDKSHFKLPRFAVIADTDIKDYFVGVREQVKKYCFIFRSKIFQA